MKVVGIRNSDHDLWLKNSVGVSGFKFINNKALSVLMNIAHSRRANEICSIKVDALDDSRFLSVAIWISRGARIMATSIVIITAFILKP